MLLKLLKEAAQTLAPAGFDIEIVEKHHNQKLDAPSGTALALADSINEAMDHRYTYKYDRSQERAKRSENEIGISAVPVSYTHLSSFILVSVESRLPSSTNI